jgi:hypothetical protein
MRKSVIFFVTLALLTMVSAAPAYAAVPQLPHAFYGTVLVNGAQAPPGTQVSATVSGGSVITNEQNPVATVGGSYGVNSPPLLVQGDIPNGAIITFHVTNANGTAIAAVTATFQSGGGPDRVDLAVTIPVPPPGGGGGGGGPGDTTPPTISDVSVSNITKTSADIAWETNEKSDSQVEYWSSPGEFSPLDTERVINHLVHLTDLTPGTTYHYKTMSRDAADNLAVSDEHTFTTLGLPPTFTTSDLSISPAEVDIGQEVTISAKVANTGDVGGTYEVTLKINGVIEETKKVDVDAGASKTVTFTVVRDVAGTYSVEVDGLKGSFTVREKPALPPTPPVTPPEEVPPVKAPINWPFIGGIIGGVVVVGLLVFFLARRRAA